MAQPAEIRIEVERPTPRRPHDCPVEDWLAFLGHRWNALILWHLNGGAKRYGELAALLPGITPKVLAERLSGLERRDLIRRSELAIFPRGVVYALSQRGEKLVAILDQVELWSRGDGGKPQA
ncbi:helix-turn-helix domain-containing protein [Bradyrhizobium prioriisuperbiae]|uniref:winged helix-turn-helix transcriptional regulator n=1 Tax=Bradyrhizobium prioriisuperbiae TaxID=2854389 RepID=UPI0028EA5DC1|nr:helix-turn-helix domain-containing protein [Bradyrhizobium prioritasuperba]